MAEARLATPDFDLTLQHYHAALDEFQRGNPEPVKLMFSRRVDVTLANPFGSRSRGWKSVAETAELAATHYRDGHAKEFESISKFVGADLAYLLEVERYVTKIDGREVATPLDLRVTSIFRLEDGEWKLVHRHADELLS